MAKSAKDRLTNAWKRSCSSLDREIPQIRLRQTEQGGRTNQAAIKAEIDILENCWKLCKDAFAKLEDNFLEEQQAEDEAVRPIASERETEYI